MQSLTSPHATRTQALRLLHIALDTHTWELARELVRFMEATTEVTEDEEGGGGGAPTSPRDLSYSVLCMHAFKLLSSLSLKSLGLFAAHMAFDLRTWLLTLRPGAVAIDNVEEAYRLVKDQFMPQPPAHGAGAGPAHSSSPPAGPPTLHQHQHHHHHHHHHRHVVATQAPPPIVEDACVSLETTSIGETATTTVDSASFTYIQDGM